MRIIFKCSGLAIEGLPPGADSMGAEIDVVDGATAGEVLAELGLSDAGDCLVVLDDQVILPSEVATRPLNEGGRLVILPPLRGG